MRGSVNDDFHARLLLIRPDRRSDPLVLLTPRGWVDWALADITGRRGAIPDRPRGTARIGRVWAGRQSVLRAAGTAGQKQRDQAYSGQSGGKAGFADGGGALCARKPSMT